VTKKEKQIQRTARLEVSLLIIGGKQKKLLKPGKAENFHFFGQVGTLMEGIANCFVARRLRRRAGTGRSTGKYSQGFARGGTKGEELS